MTTKEQNESLQTLDAQQRAEFVPKQYFDVISKRADNNKMQPALIFTADNLKSIKRYVEYVLRLPKTVEEITGSHNLSLIGLDAEQVHGLYTNLRTHVGQWEVLERETKTLGTRLDLFAQNFIQDGETLLGKLQATEAFRALKGRLGDVVDEISLKRLRFTAMGEKDRQQVASVSQYLDLLRDHVADVKSATTALKDRAQWFSEAVVKQLRPEVDAVMGQIREVNPEQTAAELRKQIAVLDKEIELGDAEYKKLVGYAFTGLVFGPLGVAITGGVYGSQAEAARTRNRRRRRERELLIKDLGSINPMLGIFESTSLQIADLTFRLTEVQTAAKNLEDVWNMLDIYVQQSGEELGLINSDIQLATFMIRFERVIRPWHSIRDISAQLSKIFNETVSSISQQGASA